MISESNATMEDTIGKQVDVLLGTYLNHINSAYGCSLAGEQDLWGALSRLCNEDSRVKHSATSLAESLIADQHDNMWGNHTNGISAILFASFLWGVANSKKSATVRSNHWIPRTYLSKFGWGGNNFPTMVKVSDTMTMTARVSVEEFTHSWEGNVREGACYDPAVESAFSFLEYRFSLSAKPFGDLSDYDLCVLGAFCIVLDARKPTGGPNGGFPDGDTGSMFSHILRAADRFSHPVVQTVRTEIPLPFLPTQSTTIDGALTTPVRSNLLVTVGDTISHTSDERLIVTYIKDTLSRTGNVVFGLTSEDVRKAAHLQ